MSQNLRRTQAESRLFLKQLIDQVLELETKALPLRELEVQVLIEYGVHVLVLGCVVEWRLTEYHLVEHDAEGPRIDFLIECLSNLEHFRSAVIESAAGIDACNKIL